jgi:ADP-ribosylglycohydrolase
MIGAVAGDIVGSIYEFDPIKTKHFPFFAPGCTFMDDSVLTVAIAQAIMKEGDYAGVMGPPCASVPWVSRSKMRSA